MAIDPPTVLLVSCAIALIVGAFLAFEARVTRDPALACWSAGFGAIAFGCAIAPLRQSYSPILGIWVANGLLIVAHLLFLRGVARFTNHGAAMLWWALLLPWMAMLLCPLDAAHSGSFGLVNSLLVGLIGLRIAFLALRAAAEDACARNLGFVFLAHGVFYCLKTVLIYVPGAFVNLLAFKGGLIQISLIEGVVFMVLLALVMATAVRGRREDLAAALAERDPLTGILNRRGFKAQAADLLLTGGLAHEGVLLLIDVDHFKAVNDTLGHAAGDQLLLALAEGLSARMPSGALVARLGGDEFVVMAPHLNAMDLPIVDRALRGDFAAAGTAFLPHHLAATLSIGAAWLSEADDLDSLMDRADAALYEAKRGGRNRLSTQPAPITDLQGPAKTPSALRFAGSGS